MKHICKNCRLYNSQDSVCVVRIVHEGRTWRDIPVDPKDKCLWEELGVAENIQQVRFWVEDSLGNPTSGNGRVRIEYPEGFFGADPSTPGAS